jgi:hypothetical protein
MTRGSCKNKWPDEIDDHWGQQKVTDEINYQGGLVEQKLADEINDQGGGWRNKWSRVLATQNLADAMHDQWELAKTTSANFGLANLYDHLFHQPTLLQASPHWSFMSSDSLLLPSPIDQLFRQPTCCEQATWSFISSVNLLLASPLDQLFR